MADTKLIQKGEQNGNLMFKLNINYKMVIQHGQTKEDTKNNETHSK